MKEAGEEEETTLDEVQEVEVMVTLDNKMMEEKDQNEKPQMRELVALRIILEEVRRKIAQTRVISNVIIVINLGIMLVNAGKRKVISQSQVQMLLI